jgi:hypothetical protein
MKCPLIACSIGNTQFYYLMIYTYTLIVEKIILKRAKFRHDDTHIKHML